MPARSRKSAARRKRQGTMRDKVVGNASLHQAMIGFQLSAASGVMKDSRTHRLTTRSARDRQEISSSRGEQ